MLISDQRDSMWSFVGDESLLVTARAIEASARKEAFEKIVLPSASNFPKDKLKTANLQILSHLHMPATNQVQTVKIRIRKLTYRALRKKQE